MPWTHLWDTEMNVLRRMPGLPKRLDSGKNTHLSLNPTIRLPRLPIIMSSPVSLMFYYPPGFNVSVLSCLPKSWHWVPDTSLHPVFLPGESHGQEEADRLRSTGPQSVGLDLATKQCISLFHCGFGPPISLAWSPCSNLLALESTDNSPHS